jgi:CRISPR-associated endonuclease/helicase Cas3
VPTGGGKTLSSLAFAIEHAVQHKLARVIYAIPFTSIIEQNAEVFRQALGEANVLEHHCNYQTQDGNDAATYNRWRGLAAENWDVPVVVTTNVQFFESLYSNATSRCRKLHNIAGSVIVLDEAQAIPTEYLKPCLLSLRELVAHYHCTVVLCTATQPAWEDANLQRLSLPQAVEIVADPARLYEELKRVCVAFVGKLTTIELAQRLDNHTQVLCIVSTKKQAQQVVSNLTDKEGAFHLSTNMYPAHRLRVLAAIRQRLADGLSCRVIATSLVEAGVDFDFPVVYRAMAGLDAIAQAAGRCNREGKAIYGQVYVYEPEEMPAMPWLQRRIARAGETLRAFPSDDCLALTPMQRFFELLYDVENLDAKDIVGRLNPRLHKEMIVPFREVAKDFRLIEDEGVGVIMPGLAEDRYTVSKRITQLKRAFMLLDDKDTIRKWDARVTHLLRSRTVMKEEGTIHKRVEQLRRARAFQKIRIISHQLQRYAVTVRSKVLKRLQAEDVIEMVRDTYPILLNAAAYDATMGFCEDMTELWDPDFFVV